VKTKRSTKPSSPVANREVNLLRARLANAEETLRAIRAGEVDTVLVTGRRNDQVFTLKGAEHAYRVLIESMNEGALTLTADKTILYANQCFARMVKCPLEQVIGSSFRRFITAESRAALRPLMKKTAGGKIDVLLQATQGQPRPVQLSIRRLAGNGSPAITFGLVVTDMTEARRAEELLRALTHRVVQVQEAERGSVALELHDNITQRLCAVLFSSQALADKLSVQDGPAKREAVKLRALLGEAAAEVERISRNLRPSILDQLGLGAMLESTCAEFAARTGVSAKLTDTADAVPLPADTELALYRIVQESLKNVEKYARARHVTVSLHQRGAYVQLLINDDGVGFDAAHHAARREGKAVLGLIGMRERAAFVGGTLTIKSGARAGTEIDVRVPLPPAPILADLPAA
jgi:two-component system NarL family sensor kinase